MGSCSIVQWSFFSLLWLQIATGTSEVSVKNLRESLEGPFGVNRHQTANPAGKAAARRHIIARFEEYGLDVTVQNFNGSTGDPDKPGTNIIGVKRGKMSGTSDDRIVAVGAHYDTVDTTPGVDDDGSGMAAMLEMARIMTSCTQQKYTVIFVAFDNEEVPISATRASSTPCDISRGADDFVCSWLLPFLNTTGRPAEFQGIFMLETIMNYDPRPNVQTLPVGFNIFFQPLYQKLQAAEFSGNFITLIRKPEEEELVALVNQTWEDRAKEPVGAVTHDVKVPVPGKPSVVQTTTFFDLVGRSDCLSFWVQDPYLRCVFVTDSANYRGSMQQCYHESCDNVTSITPDKLNFLAKVTDAILQTTIKLAEVNMDTCTKVTSAATGFHGTWSIIMLLSLPAWIWSILQYSCVI
ncbi:uncharacterized protein [Branchiostoma lanceolatum]|uniref:uncharacterized protein n=1 Tax=Branchiostoma lanceolatum TaxID=7740 RepID=UPI003456953B